MKKIASVLALFVALLFGLLACSKGASSGASGKLKVVTTNSILASGVAISNTFASWQLVSSASV